MLEFLEFAVLLRYGERAKEKGKGSCIYTYGCCLVHTGGNYNVGCWATILLV